MAALSKHRLQEYLGPVVRLLVIDYSFVSNNPAHIFRIIDHNGDKGEGVMFGGNQYLPVPYQVKSVKRAVKANQSGTTVYVSDLGLEFSRFVDGCGGNIQGARIYELKVYGRYLDDGVEPNSLSYAKLLDHLVDYVADGNKIGEVLISTRDSLSSDTKVPTQSFTCGEPLTTVSSLNIFPAVERSITSGR